MQGRRTVQASPSRGDAGVVDAGKQNGSPMHTPNGRNDGMVRSQLGPGSLAFQEQAGGATASRPPRQFSSPADAMHAMTDESEETGGRERGLGNAVGTEGDEAVDAVSALEGMWD